MVDAKTKPLIRRMLKAYGAELVDVPASEADQNGSMQVARMRRALELFETVPGAWYPCQHLSSQNPDAHYFYTAREIAASFGGSLDALLLASQNALQGLLIREWKTWRVNAATLVGVAVTLTLVTALVHAGRPGASSAAWAMMAGLAIEVLVLVHATTRQRETSAKA